MSWNTTQTRTNVLPNDILIVKNYLRNLLCQNPLVRSPFPVDMKNLVGAITVDPIQPEERQEESNEVAIIPNTSIPYPPEGLASPCDDEDG